MRFLKLGWFAAFLALLGCGGPVPDGVFLTLNVSTGGVIVATSINGKHSEFMSSEGGWMTGGGPINNMVREGDNEATFVLNAAETDDGEEVDRRFLATLEISMKGEMTDTLEPGERTIFSRELSEAEIAALNAGETVTITEKFTVDKAALEAMK
ncbi:hypothetical protein [Hyphococcus sp.]|uniref:hypothetical protein n=1 Tax=Hyphococcus sp. TaxID=2038636 RepID=UPI003753313D